jgi:hypothetical protein
MVRWYGSRLRWMMASSFLDCLCDRFRDQAVRLRGIASADHLDALADLKSFVVLEEVLGLADGDLPDLFMRASAR